MVRDQQQLLGELYYLEESLNHILIEKEMYEEIETLTNLIKRIEYDITYSVGSWGI